MQTFVLSVIATGTDTASRQAVEDGIRRVEAHYDPMWNHGPRRASHVSPTVGMVLWESEASPSLWPAWAERSDEVVASLYAPLGVERVVGEVPLEQAPFDLAQRLRQSPHRMLEVTAPFVCASLIEASDTVDLFTDVVGVGRLFEVRTPTGWVYSNRPVAALLFAGLPAEADAEGWQQLAVSDELFGHTTPYRGVRALEPATHVHWDGRARRRRVSVVDTSATWVQAPASSDSPTDDQLDAAAADLRGIASSVSRLYKGTPVVQLTGGRDSRLVAAAFVASGSELVLHTHDGQPGDLDVARRLVELAPRPLEHRIEHLAIGGQTDQPPIRVVEQARLWHDFSDGLRPCSFLARSVPSHLDADTEVTIGGVGGEAAHGFFYPRDLTTLQELPVEAQLAAFASRIVSRQAPVPGPSEDARAHVTDQVLSVLRRISSWGVRGGNVFDHYYVLQRMRRWGTAGERLGTVSPLLASNFLMAALSLSPEARKANTFHRELTRRLVPEWADMPYFPGEMRAATSAMPKPRPARVFRVGDAADRPELESLIADTGDWNAAFDVGEVHRLWHRSLSGESVAYEENVLRGVVWRAAFTDHLAGIAGESPRERPLATVPPGPVVIANPVPRARRRGLVRPAARALTRSGTWRKTRDTRLGRAIRAITARLR